MMMMTTTTTTKNVPSGWRSEKMEGIASPSPSSPPASPSNERCPVG